MLLEIARASIAHGLATGKALTIDADTYPESLRAVRACFVTLDLAGRLRGCIGHLEAYQPLAIDVAENAFAAAFRDPRFAPLKTAEWPQIGLHISVLSPPVPMQFADEADLLSQIRPGIDGLILRLGNQRGTFLPSVWDSLPNPVDFLRELKHKAGLPGDVWSAGIEVARYTTESFGAGSAP